MNIQCGDHGPAPWQGTIVCGSCGHPYQIVAEDEEFEPLCEGAEPAPLECSCGKRLAPDLKVPDAGLFWAKLVCVDCFKTVVATYRLIAN